MVNKFLKEWLTEIYPPVEEEEGKEKTMGAVTNHEIYVRGTQIDLTKALQEGGFVDQSGSFLKSFKLSSEHVAGQIWSDSTTWTIKDCSLESLPGEAKTSRQVLIEIIGNSAITQTKFDKLVEAFKGREYAGEMTYYYEEGIKEEIVRSGLPYLSDGGLAHVRRLVDKLLQWSKAPVNQLPPPNELSMKLTQTHDLLEDAYKYLNTLDFFKDKTKDSVLERIRQLIPKLSR